MKTDKKYEKAVDKAIASVRRAMVALTQAKAYRGWKIMLKRDLSRALYNLRNSKSI
jgi:hypothetical protein